jgi:UDPglucose 6-dehydrogenase
MKIGIIGKGHVGTAMSKLFVDAYIYDKNLKIGTFEEVNKSDLVFLCVPTPENKDGSCDTSIVESLIEKLKVKTIVIRSTIYIGFTDEMIKKYNKEIIFQPEYYGETVDHPYSNLNGRS